MNDHINQPIQRTFEIKHGFPLKRFRSKEKNAVNTFIEQNTIIKATNDYRPPSKEDTKDTNKKVKDIMTSISSLSILNPKLFKRMIKQDNKDNIRHSTYDPLRGNLLTSTKYMTENIQLFIYALGYSTSQIVAFFSECKEFEISNGSKVQLPLDEINVILQEELDFPIQQITISPMSSLTRVIFAVRTTVAIQMFEVSENQVKKIHIFDIHDKSATDQDLDYSVPCHLELHPTQPYLYTFITANNYFALVDASLDKVSFDGMVDIPTDIDYSSLFRSCCFGSNDHSVWIATPQCVQEHEFLENRVNIKTLYVPTDRIFGFKKIPSTTFYCIVTLEALEIVNASSKTPTIRCAHGMRDGPPLHLSIEKRQDNKWDFIGFSPFTQRVFYITLSCSETFENPDIVDMRHFQLQKTLLDEGLYPDDQIPAYGISVEKSGQDHGQRFFSIYRSFEDGSMNVQYVVVDFTSDATSMKTRPKFLLCQGEAIEKLYWHVRIAKTPTYHTSIYNMYTVKGVEVYVLDTKTQDARFETFEKEKTPLDDKERMRIAEKLKNLQSNATLAEIIKDDTEITNYDLEEISEFVDQMKLEANLESISVPETPSLLDNMNNQDDNKNRAILTDVFKETIKMSNSIIQPTVVPHSTRLQYLPRNIQFKPTTTTRLLGSLWTVDNAPSNRLEFPLIDSNNRLPTYTDFPRALDRATLDDMYNQPTEEQEDMDVVVPTIQSSAPIRKTRKEKTTVMTQPSLKSSKKKKKAKVSGFK
ncbi:unnamed protein product [Rhizopus stolonifer]